LGLSVGLKAAFPSLVAIDRPQVQKKNSWPKLVSWFR
jgi:hypothetical protein